MNSPSGNRGFILMGLLFMMVAIVAIVLSLVDETQVDYSAVRTRTDYQKLRYTVEAGLENARWSLSNNTTCTNYESLNAMSLGTSAYQAQISPQSGSPVIIEVMARDGLGNVMATESVANAVYGAPQTVEARMTPDDQDVQIEGKSGKEDHNHFDKKDLETSTKNDDEIRMLLQFTLPDIPANAVVLNASITLDVKTFDGTDSDVAIHRITRRWDEQDVGWVDSVGGFFGQWSTRGGDFESDAGGRLSLTGTGPVSTDITSIVSSWVAGADNYGLIFIGDSSIEGVTHEFVSGQGDTESERPLLTIEYACECGTSCANASTVSLPLLMSFDSSVDVDSQTFSRSDAFAFDPDAPKALARFEGAGDMVPVDANIGAVFLDADGSYVMSANESVSIGGSNFSGGDVFRFDPASGTATLLLAASRLGGGTLVDALHLVNDNTLVFSIDVDGSIDGTTYYGDDLIGYSLSSDAVWRYLDGILLFPATIGNIDAAHVFPSGAVALSFTTAETVAGVTADADDVVLFDPVTETASVYFDNNQIVQTGAGQENLDGLFVDVVGSPDIGETLSDSAKDCTGQYRDSFAGGDYAHDEGSLLFSTDWLEVGESDGAGSGDVRITSDFSEAVLRVRDNNNGGEGVQREFDLSGATSAILTLDTRRFGLDIASDYVALTVSSDGGDNWTELDRYAGPGSDSDYQSHSYNLTSYGSTETRIRFRSSSTNGNSDTVYIDNIAISLSGCP